MFGDTRVVLMGGTAERMREIAVLVVRAALLCTARAAE